MKHKLPNAKARNYPEAARENCLVYGSALRETFYTFDDHALPTLDDLRQMLSDAARMSSDVSLSYFEMKDWDKNPVMLAKYQEINSGLGRAMKALGEFRAMIQEPQS